MSALPCSACKAFLIPKATLQRKGKKQYHGFMYFYMSYGDN
jgi:hypothetical protein